MDPVLRLTREMRSGRHIWILERDWESPAGVTIPAGFQTDLGTIPHWLWSIVGPQEIAFGALTHDYYYHYQTVPRKEADAYLYHAVIPEVGKFRAFLVWAAVRLFGSYS